MPSETRFGLQTALSRLRRAGSPDSVKGFRAAPKFPPVGGFEGQRTAVLSVRGDVQPFDFADADGFVKRCEPAFFPLLQYCRIPLPVPCQGGQAQIVHKQDMVRVGQVCRRFFIGAEVVGQCAAVGVETAPNRIGEKRAALRAAVCAAPKP